MIDTKLRNEIKRVCDLAISRCPQYEGTIRQVQPGIVFNGRIWRSLGKCDVSGRIQLSYRRFAMAENFSALEDTLLHELAHAICFLHYRSMRHAHGAEWKQVAMEIGCDPRASATEPLAMPPGLDRLKARCRRCAKEFPIGPTRASRLRRKTARYKHQRCGGLIELVDDRRARRA